MKKTLISLISLSILLVSLLLLCSCGSRLKAPEDFTLNVDSQTLSWKRVPNARSYNVLISSDERERNTKTNSISLENLEPGTYEVKVKAVGDGVEMGDSDWASYTYVRQVESGLKYKAINNNTEYELVGGGTASGDVIMEDIYRGKPVTSIAEKALASNSKITSLKVGKHVTTIGKNAFTRCSELKKVELPDGVAVIGEYAFQSCKKLESITIPDSVTVIPPYMFSWCSGLKSITLGANIETVGEYAFSNCSAIEKITLPNAVKVIGEYAFSDSSTLSELTLGTGIEQIHTYAFYNCGAIATVDLGSNLKSIGSSAFGNCIAIKSITIPNSCETIESEAFRGCSNLESITLGNGLSSVGHNVFNGTKFYESSSNIVCVGGWIIDTKDKEITEFKLPAGICGIADRAFIGCEKLESVQLSGIKHIGKYSFGLCSALQNAFFDNSLLTIDDYAFYKCTLLRKITLGSSLESIGNYAFYDCSRLDNKSDAIQLPNTLKSIGSNAFVNTLAYNNTKSTNPVVYIDDWAVGFKVDAGMGVTDISVKSGTRGIANYCFKEAGVLFGIDIADSVEYIGRGAFYKLLPIAAISIKLPKNLKRIEDYAFYSCTYAMFGENGQTVIPDGCEYIGRSAFYKCEVMTGVSVPDSVKSIGAFAFYGCKSLGATIYANEEMTEILAVGKVELGNGVESIGERAFYGCEKITEITIPDSLKSLGIRAFYKCAGLKNVVIGTGLTEIPDYTFYNCTSIESITFSDSILVIGKYAFRGCSALKELNIGKSVTEIKDYAFYGCSAIKDIIIPTSVTKIGNFAFRGAGKAESVIIPSSVTEIGKHAFYGLNIATIYCEATSLPAKWNDRWNTSYRPVVLGATLSEDKTYVVSFVKSENNPDMADEIASAPTRRGYDFDGFATEADGTAEYTVENITEAPNGTALYTKWAVHSEATD